MNQQFLKMVSSESIPKLNKNSLDKSTREKVISIIEDVRSGGDEAVRKYGERFGDLPPKGGSRGRLVYDRGSLRDTAAAIPADIYALLERTEKRIKRFCLAQLESLTQTCIEIEGGRAGQRISAIETAGCYAPGGLYPLVSSVLMTVTSAKAAGVKTVWLATPKPNQEMLAAAYLAGADAVLAVGGAQAIAALAFGTESVPACDIVVGPGNRFVTAAKELISGQTAIDFLAGPSELVVVADNSADPGQAAADLLAQAEHDSDALPVLISTSSSFIKSVNQELAQQLSSLPSAETAKQALKNGFSLLVSSLEEAAAASDKIAPEHLQLLLAEPESAAKSFKHYGGLFLGSNSAEVLGDYGAGPNHVLPTGGASRSTGGLSVLTFLRVRTWICIDACQKASELYEDAAALARMEGLEAHARAAERRLP